MDGRWRGIAFLILFVVVMATAAGVRVYRLSGESAWWDEVASLQHLDAPDLFTFLKLERVSDPPMTPVYFALQYAWSRVAGTSLVAVRLLSILLGCICIVLTSAWAYERGGPWAGAITGIVSALSLPHIYYSQEVRPYALVLLLVVCSSYTFMKAIHTSNTRWWAANVAANILLMWTHLFASLLLLVQGIFLLVHALRNRRVRLLFIWTAAYLPSIVLWGIWFATIDYRALDHASLWKSTVVHSPSLLMDDFSMFAGGRLFRFREAVMIPGIGTGLLFSVIFLAAIAGLGLRVFRGERDRESVRTYLYWLLWLAMPPVTLFTFSALLYPSHIDRYVLYSMLPLHLIMGCFVASIRRIPLRVIAAAALIILMAANTAMTPKPWRLDWKSISTHVASRMKPDDALIVWGDVHCASLAYSIGLPKERIICADGIAGVANAARRSVASGHTAWITGRVDVFNDPAHGCDLDAALTRAGVQYTRTEFGNAQPHLVAYQVPAAVSKTRAPGIP